MSLDPIRRGLAGIAHASFPSGSFGYWHGSSRLVARALGTSRDPQPGTLQPPSGPSARSAGKAPAAAPREPVRKASRRWRRRRRWCRRTGRHIRTSLPRKPPAAPKPRRSCAARPCTRSAGTETKAPPTEKLPDPEKPEGAPAKLPRFASLRSDDVNMRAGPGTRYRIDWVYKRRDLPVEIEREFDVWRWVRDPDGIQGWVHQATLMGRRSFIVQKADATLAVGGQAIGLGCRDPQAGRDRAHPVLRGRVRLVQRADRILPRYLRREHSGACCPARRSIPDEPAQPIWVFNRETNWHLTVIHGKILRYDAELFLDVYPHSAAFTIM